MTTVAKAAVKPISTNGTTSTSATPETVKPVPLQKVTKEEKEIPPLEDRLLKLNQLYKKQSDYMKLQESLNKLNEFELKKEGERCELSIEDQKRQSFSTFNPEIIEEVINFLKAKIKDRITRLEPQLMW